VRELDLDTRFLAPLPQPMWGVACSHCDKPQARWEMRTPSSTLVSTLGEKEEATIICSLCFLYDSVWAEDRREALDIYIAEVEKAEDEARKEAAKSSDAQYLLPFRFAKNDTGRLVYATDGDRLLAGVALANRTMQLRTKVVQPER
jgi:hypothetical protein